MEERRLLNIDALNRELEKQGLTLMTFCNKAHIMEKTLVLALSGKPVSHIQTRMKMYEALGLEEKDLFY